MNATSTAELQELLNDKFGWSEFKEGQTDVISRLIEGKSVLAVFPTGGGKSLCYQLPALKFEGLTVVVSPLIALMKDQIDQLKQRGHKAVRLDSSLTADEYREATSLIRNGQAKLLYVAPERFFNERFRSSLEGVRISMFAIDEAHCISQWGHNFRPDYLKLAGIANELNVERVLALTATATPSVQQDICEAFSIAADDVVCTEFYRPNLYLRTNVVSESSRLRVLTDKLKSQPPAATIIYVTLQKTAEQVAEFCAEAGFAAQAYHAGMETEKRNEIQEWFMDGADHIVVATIAFGMGIDKANIRNVFHFNPPKSIENYAQEIGRAGRDGLESRCEMLLVPEDRIVLENFVFGDTPTLPSLQEFFLAVDQLPDEFYISQYKLANQCDIKVLVVKTLLTYLELDGYIKSTSPRYDSFAFKPIVGSSIILGNFEGERQEFVKGLLACSEKKKVWCYLDVPFAMQKLNCERSKIVRAMDFFADNQWIELKVSGLVHGYRKLKVFPDLSGLADDFMERMQQRETSGISRIDQIFEFAAATECQASNLSAHFGQPLDANCGNCSFCIGEGVGDMDSLTVSGASAKLPSNVTSCIGDLVKEHKEVLSSERAIARFLCGLTSPALTRAKLSKHDLFGSCSEISFGKVMQQVAGPAGVTAKIDVQVD